MDLNHKKANEVMKWFREISNIPRPSKDEEKIIAWMKSWASKNGFPTESDEVGNLLIKVPGSKGYENRATVALQGHLDMVCEKTPDSTHDFSKDPIKFVYEGEWLKGDKTTLGADNGIALAIALTLVLDKDVEHPPLELLFTVDEETGLTGAFALKPGFLTGSVLLNLDSEEVAYLDKPVIV